MYQQLQIKPKQVSAAVSGKFSGQVVSVADESRNRPSYKLLGIWVQTQAWSSSETGDGI
jgi:hypothetical protein